MFRNFLRNTALTLSTLMFAGSIAASRPHFAPSTTALSQPTNDGNDPGGGGGGNDGGPCTDNCVVRAL